MNISLRFQQYALALFAICSAFISGIHADTVSGGANYAWRTSNGNPQRTFSTPTLNFSLQFEANPKADLYIGLNSTTYQGASGMTFANGGLAAVLEFIVGGWGDGQNNNTQHSQLRFETNPAYGRIYKYIDNLPAYIPGNRGSMMTYVYTVRVSKGTPGPKVKITLEYFTPGTTTKNMLLAMDETHLQTADSSGGLLKAWNDPNFKGFDNVGFATYSNAYTLNITSLTMLGDMALDAANATAETTRQAAVASLTSAKQIAQDADDKAQAALKTVPSAAPNKDALTLALTNLKTADTLKNVTDTLANIPASPYSFTTAAAATNMTTAFGMYKKLGDDTIAAKDTVLGNITQAITNIAAAQKTLDESALSAASAAAESSRQAAIESLASAKALAQNASDQAQAALSSIPSTAPNKEALTTQLNSLKTTESLKTITDAQAATPTTAQTYTTIADATAKKTTYDGYKTVADSIVTSKQTVLDGLKTATDAIAAAQAALAAPLNDANAAAEASRQNAIKSLTDAKPILQDADDKVQAAIKSIPVAAPNKESLTQSLAALNTTTNLKAVADALTALPTSKQTYDSIEKANAAKTAYDQYKTFADAVLSKKQEIADAITQATGAINTAQQTITDQTNASSAAETSRQAALASLASAQSIAKDANDKAQAALQTIPSAAANKEALITQVNALKTAEALKTITDASAATPTTTQTYATVSDANAKKALYNQAKSAADSVISGKQTVLDGLKAATDAIAAAQAALAETKTATPAPAAPSTTTTTPAAATPTATDSSTTAATTEAPATTVPTPAPAPTTVPTPTTTTTSTTTPAPTAPAPIVTPASTTTTATPAPVVTSSPVSVTSSGLPEPLQASVDALLKLQTLAQTTAAEAASAAASADKLAKSGKGNTPSIKKLIQDAKTQQTTTAGFVRQINDSIKNQQSFASTMTTRINTYQKSITALQNSLNKLLAV